MYAHALALACTPKEISMKVTVTVTPASPLPGWSLPTVSPSILEPHPVKNGLIFPYQA